jgi:hypothetical protein
MDKIHALSQAILRSLHEYCDLPILRLIHLLPLVTISLEAQPIRTFPVSEGHMLRYSRIQSAVPAMCLPPACRQPLCNAQAPDFILPPILGTAEVATCRMQYCRLRIEDNNH